MCKNESCHETSMRINHMSSSLPSRDLNRWREAGRLIPHYYKTRAMTYMTTRHCPLCCSVAKAYHQDRDRAYAQCLNCQLVFVHPEAFLSAQEEKSRYDLHQNSPSDTGYRTFLSRMCVPMMHRLPRGSCGLDFGCGPGPTLSVMFEESGYPMAIYDPFYAADESVLENDYDFVTATEVIEHVQRPKQSLKRMWRCVKAGGYLGIMTQLVIDQDAFAKWHYKDDETHICFYSQATFGWIARQWETEPVFVGHGVIIFQKPKCSHSMAPSPKLSHTSSNMEDDATSFHHCSE